MVTAEITSPVQDHETLIGALQKAELYPHPVKNFTLIETHISSVILTGEFAYKFKKPVNLGFLDFSTLEKRKFYCEEELRLNRRLAPQLYLDVIPIGGSISQPVLGQTDKVIEYTVRMHEFPQSAQLDNLLANQALQQQHIDQLAETVVHFHGSTKCAAMDSVYGNPQQVYQPVLENFKHIRRSIQNPELLARLDKLETWSRQRFQELEDKFMARKQQGFIRECHGDMHLHNMALIKGEVVLFDCIEFNPGLRWIDTISDIAFLVMDLEDRQQHEMARRFLNRYLELTGDYAGIELLDYYKVYRALVRAKVAAIRLGQSHISETNKQETLTDFANYLALAENDTRQSQPGVIVTRGISGSGKTYYSQQLLEQANVIRIRSDVERLRLFPDNNEKQRYSASASQDTYQQLLSLAELITHAGYSVIVDAAFLDSRLIQPFRKLAVERHLPFVILEFTATPATLRQRISQRINDASEATVRVMEHQLQDWQELPAELQAETIRIDTEQKVDIKQIANKLTQD